MGWTKDQQMVIDSRGGNLLVSAAAGSGKTAVLVERMIQMVMDPKHPVDIDHLLVVTFTKAAASEMKERVEDALSRELALQPGNEHLNKQLSLVRKAKITTIDSFCMDVVRSHFNQLHLDPNFRIGEEAELSLLSSDILAKTLEQKYQEADPDFLYFVESYSVGKTDQAIEDLIKSLYSFAASYPRPEEWMARAEESFAVQAEEELMNSCFIQELLCLVRKGLEQARQLNELALTICQEPGGPIQYEKTLLADRIVLSGLAEGNCFRAYQERFAVSAFARLSGRAKEGADENKQRMVKQLRDEMKGKITGMTEDFFQRTVEEILEDYQSIRPAMHALIEVTKAFSAAYMEAKSAKNLMDFSDLEHYALKVLSEGNGEDGRPIPSVAARELAEYYEEIMIDEYQDSNLIQEEILTSVSRSCRGIDNVFMVGDVKQSIYKFRLARPELFLDKYNRYPRAGEEPGEGKADSQDHVSATEKKIELHQNFRSRSEVLHSVNDLFGQLMAEDLGGIAYTDDAALVPGLPFAPCEGLSGGASELLIADLSKEESIEDGSEVDDAALDTGKRELEAKVIADRIHELMDAENPFCIVDKGTGEYRKVAYRDIVILLRTVSGWADLFEEVLMREGIPAHCESQTGYFSAVEVQNVLSFLSVVDNVLLDIPLAGVLRSPMGGFTGEELARLKQYQAVAGEDQNLYTYLSLCAEEDEETSGTIEREVTSKCRRFLVILEELREARTYRSIRELIQLILDRTGYYDYVGAMPQGRKRQANLRMLMEKGTQYESTSYKGVFHFVRYMNQLKEYEIDFGEARVLGDGEDVVRIMSIHKSKGLEFPVVFVSGLAKRFNQMDAAGRIVIHPDYLIGPDLIRTDLRTKAPTLMKTFIKKQMILENLGEELRVLYVALTRPKEKLIMTAAVENLSKMFDKVSYVKYSKEQVLSFDIRAGARSYLEWILSALVRPQDRIEQRIVPISSLVLKAAAETLQKDSKKEELLHWKKPVEKEIQEAIRTRFAWEYPFRKEVMGKSKYTVSEIKKMGQNIDDRETENLLPILPVNEQLGTTAVKREEQPEILICIPDELHQQSAKLPEFLMDQQKEPAPEARGTIVHKILELLDYANADTEEAIQSQVVDMSRRGAIPEEYARFLPISGIHRFVNSLLGRRMAEAAGQGLLKREAQYVMGLPMSELDPDSESQELVLIQGIVDLYFEEEGKLVIVDYKTDHVAKGQESVLKQRYALQVAYYKKALEQITGKPVKEAYLYSFSLQKSILM